MHWRTPERLHGTGSVEQLPALLKAKGVRQLLVVTDARIMQLGLADPFLSLLREQDIGVSLYDQIEPNPTTAQIEAARQLYEKTACDAIAAFGGGSVIDCAKAAAARIARPGRTLREMRGQLKVRRDLPLLAAVPTTAGTGSEATVAAVVSEPETKEKYAVNDTVLIPHIAVHDPLLTVGMPPAVTAETGMDALTHAVEAYIGRSGTKETKRLSESAVPLILSHLPAAYADGEDLEARGAMLEAAYQAGRAFTRAYVGNIHAVAHTLSAWYGVPHGRANAVVMPHVLRYYGTAVHRPLAALADAAGLDAGDEAARAEAFIRRIEKMNEQMGLPAHLPAIRTADLPFLVEQALAEANPLYPVPVIFGRGDMTLVYRLVQGTA
ncbi:iron-containing alcohol dehydrogenase [Alkalicoccus chagannorensis]|uniref:iron-containing alcohol dehydrogenase n=1 Tax=Alkalicoccus chagannorensis TaxID=427072 RepID=UPI001FDFED77|nr:iron-containing alcohol dehydrogenase [Alkalicoccus chagannorensis]